VARKNPRVPVDIVAQTTKFDSAVKKSAKAATASFTAFAAASTAAVVGITKATINLSGELNQLAKDAQRIGVSVEEYQKLEGAIGHLTDGTVRTTDALQEYQKRTGEAAPDLVMLAERFSGLDSAAERTALGMELFGSRAGKQLAGALSEGGAAVQEAIDRVEDAGLVSSEAAFQAEALQDSLDDASRAMLVMRTEALAPLMPVIAGTTGAISNLAAELRDTGALKQFGDQAALIFLEVVLPAITVAGAESVKALRGLATSMALAEVGFNAIRISALGYVSVLDAVKNGGKITREQYLRNKAALDDLHDSQARLDAATISFMDVDEKAAQLLDRVTGEVRAQQAAFDELAQSKEKVSSAGGGDQPPDGPGGPAPVADLGAAEKLAAELEAINERKQLEAQVAAELIELDEHVTARAKELAEERKQARLEATVVSLSAATSALNAIDTLAGAVSDARVANMDRESDEYRRAMDEQWGIQSALAIANAAIAIPLAISQQLAGTPGPVGIALSVVAGAIATANLAATIAKAAAGPTYHMGGMVGGGPARSISPAGSPDEVNATLLRGERVQSRAEVRAGRGPQTITTVFRVGPRTVDAMTTEALRTGQGSTFDAFRAVQPRRVGRHNPRRRR